MPTGACSGGYKLGSREGAYLRSLSAVVCELLVLRCAWCDHSACLDCVIIQPVVICCCFTTLASPFIVQRGPMYKG
jgi:hypothetical protein